MTHLAISEISGVLQEAVHRLDQGEECVVIKMDGKDVAALVSLEEYRLFQAWEDRADEEAYRRAKEDFEASGEEAIPYEVIRKEAGLR